MQQATETTRKRPASEKPQVRPDTKAKDKPGRTGLSYKETRELDAVEAEIARLETRTQELDALLSDTSAYQERRDDMPGWVAEREQAEARTLALMERWEELEAKRDAGA
jgi:ATP-binding cassette subfamily F protein uup